MLTKFRCISSHNEYLRHPVASNEKNKCMHTWNKLIFQNCQLWPKDRLLSSVVPNMHIRIQHSKNKFLLDRLIFENLFFWALGRGLRTDRYGWYDLVRYGFSVPVPLIGTDRYGFSVPVPLVGTDWYGFSVPVPLIGTGGTGFPYPYHPYQPVPDEYFRRITI